MTGPPVVDRAPAYGWARRAIYGGGGPSGRAWRALATPLGAAWGKASERRLARLARNAVRLPHPVVSVGNVTVGGGGKTSLVRWIVASGLPAGATAAVLARGAGRADEDVVRVLAPGGAPAAGPAAARAGGDEPELLARAGAWVGVGADRAAAARAVLRSARPDLFLLDDGLQHRRIARALDLVTFTADDLAAPARCVPAGPLRQPAEWRPAMAAWVVVGADPRAPAWPPGSIGAAFAGWWDAVPGTPAEWVDAGSESLAEFAAGGAPPPGPAREPAPPASLARPVVAFAGVARPESLVASGAAAGFEVERVVAFPDHHAYGPEDAARLLAAHPGAELATTEKDAVKLDPAWFGDRPVHVLRRRLEPADPDLVRSLVRAAIAWRG